MTHLLKLKLYPILRWGSSNLPSNILRLQKYPFFRTNFPCSCSYNNVDVLYKHYSTIEISIDKKVDVKESSISCNGEKVQNISVITRKKVEGALFEYLHSTRNLTFMDAEYLSKNSPKFVKMLANNFNSEATNIRRSLSRFLRYHPINEFELFFESMGLDPSKFVPSLPRASLYLNDEEGLLSNFRVLYEYGIPRDGLGKIYRMTREVFQYGDGVLISKFRAFEALGFSSSVIAKAVSINPYLLIDDVGYAIFEVVSKLQCLGCEYDWIEQHLLENASYNWRQIFALLVMLNDMGCKGTDLGELLRKHPELLFDRSGRSTYSVVGFLLKFGSTKNDIRSMFLDFPEIKVHKFAWNLGRAFKFLSDSQMNSAYTGRILRTHFMMLGSSSLKKVRRILASLNIGGKHCREHIRDVDAHKGRIKFLSSIGFAENSEEMEKALKNFRGKGVELQERFDCLVKAGLSEEDVVAMVKGAPHVLNQSREVLETKIIYLVNDLGYPVSCLKPFPYYLSYSMERVKLRCSMFKWLVNKGVFDSKMSLRTIIAPPESKFVKKFVNKHPQGLDVWQGLKNNFCAGVKVKQIHASLDIGGTHCCEHAVANPSKPKKQVSRAKVKRLPGIRRMQSHSGKIKFLSGIGFAENSKEMDKALKLYRGKGDELQERFDCLVKAGLSEEDVMVMIKGAPHILTQSKEILETKIRYLVNDLGYPVSSLKPFPYYLSYSMERVKLRCSMFKWLVDKNVVESTVALRTRVASTESCFVQKFVDKHPQGLDVWQELKNKVSA